MHRGTLIGTPFHLLFTRLYRFACPGRRATADATHRKATIFLIVIIHAEAARTVGSVGTA
jgi:hypothetical protein